MCVTSDLGGPFFGSAFPENLLNIGQDLDEVEIITTINPWKIKESVPDFRDLFARKNIECRIF